MNENILSQYVITNFKRKRKPDVRDMSYENLINSRDNKKKYKHIVVEDSKLSRSDSSSSTTPLYSAQLMNNIKREEELSLIDSLSSDEGSSIISKNTTPSVKMEPSLYQRGYPEMKTELIYNNPDCNDQVTFCVDMSRYESFATNSLSKSNFLNTDFLNFDSPLTKIELPSSPKRVQRNRRNQNHVYKEHKHNKMSAITKVPCKGPACQNQVCCAQFCSQVCYANQMRPIGTGCLKNSMLDYETSHQQEINVTDYGLPYADHTYCRDHKNIYFSHDLNIDSPPYCDLVEKLFYDEKEMRIKNPVPEPNVNGDPISSNGYICQTGRRGRPKRSNVIGLLDPYIFHPSTDVVYTPFLFKETIIKADRISNQMQSERPVKDAIRQCSNLYRDVRSDVPPHVIYGGGMGSGVMSSSTGIPVSGLDLMAKLSCDQVDPIRTDDNCSDIDHLFDQAIDDDDDDDDDFSIR